jgi:hypothetical protein
MFHVRRHFLLNHVEFSMERIMIKFENFVPLSSKIWALRRRKLYEVMLPKQEWKAGLQWRTYCEATTQYTRSSEHTKIGAVFSVDRATARC